MERLSISHQTLKEFIEKPFGFEQKQRQLRYEDRYQKFKKENKIKIEASLKYEDNYFVHIKVPSESQHGEISYDVVIQFFPSDGKSESRLNVEDYYVQFFSNSPGFVYKYAALYKTQGYLIETLLDKYGLDVLDTLPDKANSTYELYYDSSIYYASRYLLDNKLFVLGKLNLRIFRNKSLTKFLSDIQDFESVNLSRNITQLASSLKKELAKDKKLSYEQESKLKKNSFFAKEITNKRDKDRGKKHSTFKDSSNESKRKTAKKSTSTGISTKRVTAKKAKKSTIKR